MKQFPPPTCLLVYRGQKDIDIENYKVGDVGQYSQFRNSEKTSKKVTYSRTGKHISVSNGNETVAFEVERNLPFLSTSNSLTFDLPVSVIENNLQ
uniref:hypothetical protein n=1 Tax=Bacteroides fragilis TaxID=817 RepID=UPI003564C24E